MCQNLPKIVCLDAEVGNQILDLGFGSVLAVQEESRLVVALLEAPDDSVVTLARRSLELQFNLGVLRSLLDIRLDVRCTTHDLTSAFMWV